jgi:hypothetical protein
MSEDERKRQRAEESRLDAEALRIKAEREREDHELRRRIAEGGPDQHVPGDIVSPPGRWERDLERQKADERRGEEVKTVYDRVTKLYALRVAAIFVIPLLVIIVFLYRNDSRLDDEIRNRCIDGMINRDAIRASLIDGLGALGFSYNAETNRVVQTGTPIDYYRTHPDELKTALVRAQNALNRFPPISC